MSEFLEPHNATRYSPPPRNPHRYGRRNAAPASQMRPVSRRDLAALYLTGVGVDIVERDLLPVDVQSSYDGLRNLLKLLK
ncbi:MAG: hypothetical protein ABI384_08790 [Allobranchiibius sp.]